MSLIKSRSYSGGKFIPLGSTGLITADDKAFQVILKAPSLVYPLKQYRIKIGEKTVYDRDTRGKSWFIADLILPGSKFVPLGSTGLITANDEALQTTSRHKEKM